MKKLFIIFIVSICVLKHQIANAQTTYVYTSLKVPIFDYIAYTISGNKNPDNSKIFDGVLFDAGVGIHVKKSFYIETGIEYYIVNRLIEKKYDTATSLSYTELIVFNSAISIQGKPTFIFQLNEEKSTQLRVVFGLNYQKLFSNASITNYPLKAMTLDDTEYKNSESSFFFSAQPALGIQFKLAEKLDMGFDLAYINVNWDKSMNNLKFDTKFDVPSHRTTNAFISARIVF